MFKEVLNDILGKLDIKISDFEDSLQKHIDCND
jgi:hypothetical protein